MTDISSDHFDWEPQEQYRAWTTSIYRHHILEHLLHNTTKEHVVLWQITLTYNLKITVYLYPQPKDKILFSCILHANDLQIYNLPGVLCLDDTGRCLAWISSLTLCVYHNSAAQIVCQPKTKTLNIEIIRTLSFSVLIDNWNEFERHYIPWQILMMLVQERLLISFRYFA